MAGKKISAIMDRNSTSFGALLRRYFESLEYESGEVLNYTQWVVVQYMAAVERGEIVGAGRGLIVNHEMGTGKTITAIALSDALQRAGYGVIVIGPKSLSTNFAANVTKLRKLRSDESILSGGYNYFTMRASNLPDQLIRAEVGSAPTVSDASEDLSIVSLSSVFENKVILIDEAHMFFNSVAHGRAAAGAMYRAMMATKRCWIFPFTGTLTTNSPFETVPAYNLVAGSRVLPEDAEEFEKLFGEDAFERNRGKLQNICSGLVSYAASGEDPLLWPTKLASKIVRLSMEGGQLAAYAEARLVESAEDAASAKKGRFTKTSAWSQGFTANDSKSSYRVRSRIASNGPNKCGWICELVMTRSLENILVQNVFVERGGLRDIAAALEATCAYREFVVGVDGVIVSGPPDLVGKPWKAMVLADGTTWESLEEAPSYPQRWYCILSGDTKPEIRDTLVSVLQDPRNRYGAFIHVLLCSSVGSTGLDLKNGRHVVYVAPEFHIENYNQTVARYVRFGASVMLPPDLRTVQPYILVSVTPAGLGDDGEKLRSGEARPEATDERLLSIAMRKMRSNAKHADLRRSVSIECLAGVSATPWLCRRCEPTGRRLTTGNYRHDMMLPDVCVPLPNEMDDARRLTVMVGETELAIAVLRAPLRFFEVRAGEAGRAESYLSIGPSHPLYKSLRAKVGEA